MQVHQAVWNPAIDGVSWGPLIRTYVYDGLGRLVQATRPVDNEPNVVERYVYDGVRRVQDWVDEGQGFTLDREYAWGFGGAVDELVAEYDAAGEPYCAIHDLSGDLVAMCDLNGPGGAARVVGQWTYEPYGGVLTAEYPVLGAQPPPRRLGHKGLFFDRLVDGATTPNLWPHVPVVYHVRNRAYRPEIGSWLQRDPNASGAVVFDLSITGLAIKPRLRAFELSRWTADGFNTYGYVANSPLLYSDPMGLYLIGPGWNGGISLVIGGQVFDGFDDLARIALQDAKLDASAIARQQQAQAAARQARARGTMGRSAALQVLLGASRAAGAVFAATFWDDGLAGNATLGYLLSDIGLSTGVGLVDSAVPFNSIGAGSLTLQAAQGQSLCSVLGSLGTNLATGAIANAGTAVLGQAAPAIVGAALYSGFLEYTADAVDEWW